MLGFQLNFLDRIITKSPKSRGKKGDGRPKFPTITRLLPSTQPSRRERVLPEVKRQKKESDPMLKTIWLEVRAEFFPDRPDLDDYAVYWSKRNQIRTLASCNFYSKRISVARELNHPNHFKWLHPLLYHEMCHGYLGEDVPEKNGKKRWHGAEFRALEHRHPRMEEFEMWIKVGGWHTAVRSHRARQAHARRRGEDC